MPCSVIAYDKGLPELRQYACERIPEATGTAWRCVRVDQADFEERKPATVADLTKALS